MGLCFYSCKISVKKQRVSIKSPQIQTLIASLEKKFFELIQNNEHKIR